MRASTPYGCYIIIKAGGGGGRAEGGHLDLLLVALYRRMCSKRGLGLGPLAADRALAMAVDMAVAMAGGVYNDPN